MKPDTIILHHSFTKDGVTVNWQAIRRYHMETLGWKEVGYHLGVELVGERYEVLMGRMLNEQGAHCKQEGMNGRSLGICIIGNFDEAPPPEDQWFLTVCLVRALCDTCGISKNRIFGHSKFAPYKSCPGAYFDVSRLVSMI